MELDHGNVGDEMIGYIYIWRHMRIYITTAVCDMH